MSSARPAGLRESGRAARRGSAQNAPGAATGARSEQRSRPELVAIAYLLIAVAALIALRALVEELDFISFGWILVLAALPLLPWLLPRFGEFVKAISPYVESVKLGALQLDLRSVRRDAISVPSDGILASVANDVAALSSGTAIQELVAAFRDFRRKGGGPVVVIDLQDGHKWRLPNLYFVTRLLETEPVISELVFTEARGGTDGYLVGSCRPDELRRHVELAAPAYAAASVTLDTPAARNLNVPEQANQMGASYMAFLAALGPSSGTDDDPVRGWVTPERIRTILVGLLSTAAVELVGETLDDQDVRVVVASPHRYVPATSGERLMGLVDRETVSLAVARAALASD